MTNHPNDERALLDLVEKHAGDDFVRQHLSWALHKVMEAEVGKLTGAERASMRRSARPRATAIARATGTRGSARAVKPRAR